MLIEQHEDLVWEEKATLDLIAKKVLPIFLFLFQGGDSVNVDCSCYFLLIVSMNESLYLFLYVGLIIVVSRSNLDPLNKWV